MSRPHFKYLSSTATKSKTKLTTGDNGWESLPGQGYTTLNSEVEKTGVMSTSLFIHYVEQADLTGRRIL